MAPQPPPVRVENLTMAYGNTVIQKGLTFTVEPGDIFIIMGGSGCGKSTLLRHLVGLKAPAAGKVFHEETDFFRAPPPEQAGMKKKWGLLFQSGALFSSMTLEENVALPLLEYTDLSPSDANKIVRFKLSLVGLSGFETYYPSQISGGMQKRAGLARAMALDPKVLFCDEPSAGLDPVSARRLDDLIIELKESMGVTVVVVTHELASIFAVGTNSVFLDPVSKTMIAGGSPSKLLSETDDPRVLQFLTRGEKGGRAQA